MIETTARVVLVTGAARRIGATIAEYFHNKGHRVILHCNRSTQEANALAARLNTQRPESAVSLSAELADARQVSQLAIDALEAFGAIDVLVNNASAFYPTEVGSVSAEDWDLLIGSNLRGAFFLSQALAANLKSRRGSIVNIVDSHAGQTLKGFPVYSIAKSGLLAMTRSLAKELAPEVTVNSVSPGAILWPEHGAAAQIDEKQALAKIPLGRLGTPLEIASLVYFLATQASYMTGADIKVDGGRSIG